MKQTTDRQSSSGAATSQPPDNPDREYVESVWEKVIELRSIFSTHSMGVRILVPDGPYKSHKIDFGSWCSAAEFTRRTLEELEKLDEEILWAMEFRFDGDYKIYDRLRDRLDAIRADGIRGMKAEFLDNLNQRLKTD